MTAAETIARILADRRFQDAVATMTREHDRTVADIITLTEIPSPPFAEERRASAYLEMLRAHGLEEVEQGPGSAMSWAAAAAPGTAGPWWSPPISTPSSPPAPMCGCGGRGRSCSPPGSATTPAASRSTWPSCAPWTPPGSAPAAISCSSAMSGRRGSATCAACGTSSWRAATADKVDAFFTVDSPEVDRIVTRGIGSKRYRVTFRGPGGHSFSAFGLVNPAYAMARAMLTLSALAAPDLPQTTHCASVMGGGTSVNAIPNEVWMEVDLRSQSAAELARLEAEFLAGVEAATAAENAVRSTREGAIVAEVTPIGDRPAGHTAPDAAIVQLATAAVAAHGYTPQHSYSSTDANIPMSLGIPAIKIGSGGRGGRAHSLEEWIDVEPVESLRGMSASLATILAVAGMEEG